jgi:uncharacterized protein YfaS (alpha-2-macroglobulin family)
MEVSMLSYHRRPLSWIVAATLVLAHAAAADADLLLARSKPLGILRITPSGLDIPPTRQIVFQFDRAVVPVGRMERDADEIPIEISPDPGCEWRWLDTASLACQLGEDNALLPSTRYRVVIRPGITTEDGATLAEPVEHEFVTQRPRVANAWFRTWKSPGTPELFVVFNQEIVPESAEGHLRFRAENGDILAAKLADAEAGATAWLVTPAKELPHDALVSLESTPGLLSPVGNEAGIESRVILQFHTIPAPRLIGIECSDNRGKKLSLTIGEDGIEDKRCDPLGTVWLLFSSPVIKEELQKGLRVDPDLAGGREDYEPWDAVRSRSQLSGRPPRNRRYYSELPRVLRAYHDYHLTASAEEIRDEFGRPLAEDIDFRFRTDHRRPRLVLGHNASVLETGVETHLPVVLTNLRQLNVSLNVLTGETVDERTSFDIEVPQVEDVAFRFPLEVREWLDGQSGAVVGSLRSQPSTGRHPPWFFSQVTPYHVHVKLGHYNTMVWVTDLATGEPVEGAGVEVIERIYETLGGTDAPLDEAVTDERGTAVLGGTEKLDPGLKLIEYWRNRDTPHLFVRVRRGDAQALVPISQDFIVHPTVPNTRLRKHGHLRAWGATAQGVYRAGDTVQYKVYVRNEGNERLTAAPAGNYHLSVTDPMGKVVHERDGIVLNDFGAFDGEFKVPETGAVGWYRFVLRPDFAGNQTWEALRVLVTDFTPAPFRVATDLDGELFEDGDDVVASTSATLHAGGPYVEAQTRVTAILRPETFRSTAPQAKGFWFDTAYAQTETIHGSQAVLDDEGKLDTEFAVRSEKIQYGSLTVESAVRDDRGKYIAGRTTARFTARDRFVGIRQDDWVLEAGESASVDGIVTDENGKVVAGVPMRFSIEHRETKASRVKGAGNAYLTHYIHEWNEVASCDEESAEEAVTCTFTPASAGRYRMTVSIEDTRGRATQSEVERWAAGKGVVLWEQPAGHNLEIFPESETLRVGDTARYLIKNPFPGARALVTIERLGVMKSWIETLSDSTAILEFPVEPDFVPGFYLSVVVMSPRVERPPGEGDVDLGKPSFRMGYVQSTVRDPYKEIRVTVEPEAEVYKPRQTVSVDIRAAAKQGDVPEIEFAVAALDEAVLDLLAGGSAKFDPYAGFYDLGGLDLWNYNLLTRLIGIQKFEKKGANPGGGGGLDPEVRSQFKFVSYWNPSIRADAEGRASIEFEVPDNLTGWRVLVMAVTPEDRMGLGQETFRVNLPTEIRPALPNQVIQGDRFDARFTVMNRTDSPRTLEVTGSAEGSVRGTAELRTTLEAEPYKRYPVSLPVTTAEPGEVRFQVRAGDGIDADGLAVAVPVNRRTALVTAATYGTTTEKRADERVRFPDGIREDVGGLSVVAGPTVIGNIEGAFRYMRDYPYLCWEQILSKGVMAAHYIELRSYLPEDLEWPESAMLPRATLERAADFQAPAGGMAYFVPTDMYVSPYLSAYTALAFAWLRDAGYEIPSGVESRLHDYLLAMLRKDVFPSFYSKGMSSSVRAVALAALARSGKVDERDLSRYRRHVQSMDLFGKAHYLQALQRVDGTDELRGEVMDAILAHANETAGKIVFSETLDNGYARILHSEMRTGCVILDSLVAEGETALTEAGAAKLPFKVVRAVTQTRGQRHHWENTQENLFCTNALIEYSRAYEEAAPKFTVKVDVGSKSIGKARFDDVKDPDVVFERPIREGDAGRDVDVRIRRSGEGRLYYAVRLSYSPSEIEARRINSGIEIRREYSVERDGGWVRLDDPATLAPGELVRVDLYVSLPAARNFVVVDDPIPGGLEPVNRDLATASTVDADKARMEFPPDAHFFEYDDWYGYGVTRWSFYHQELRHDSARFYSDYLPAGRYLLSYVAQVIAPGRFAMLPVKAEEMYDPDVFGRGLPGTLVVEQGTE